MPIMRGFFYEWDTCAMCAAASMEVGALLLPPAMITDVLNPEAVALLREPPMQLSIRADAAPGVQIQPVCVCSQNFRGLSDAHCPIGRTYCQDSLQALIECFVS